MGIKKIWYYGYDLRDGWDMSDADYEHHLLTGDLIARDRPDIASEPYSIEDIRTHLEGHYGFYYFDKCDLYFYVDNVLEFEKNKALIYFQNKPQRSSQNQSSLSFPDLFRYLVIEHVKLTPQMRAEIQRLKAERQGRTAKKQSQRNRMNLKKKDLINFQNTFQTTCLNRSLNNPTLQPYQMIL